MDQNRFSALVFIWFARSVAWSPYCGCWDATVDFDCACCNLTRPTCTNKKT